MKADLERTQSATRTAKKAAVEKIVKMQCTQRWRIRQSNISEL
jgi:hypothetical protein